MLEPQEPVCLAYVGLGSNIGDSRVTLREIVVALDTVVPQTRCVATSALYRTKPLGPAEGEFLNAAALLHTQLAPKALLDALLALELARGRQRLQRWGSRTLDLDLLIYRTSPAAPPLVHREPGLQLPHPELLARDFVLAPLCDLQAPPLCDGGVPLSQVLRDLPDDARTILSREETWL